MNKVSDEVDMSIDMATDGEIRLDADPLNQYVDCCEAFTTTEVFPTRDNLLNWARGVAVENGFVIVILRSDRGEGRAGRKTFVLLGCERSGKYKPYKEEFTRKVTGTRKCECPFRLRGKPLKNGEGWKVNMVCGFHNHGLAETLVGHPYGGRLNKEEKSLLGDMTNNAVKPKDILPTPKDHNEGNVTTVKQIYNAQQQHRRSQKGPRTEMQHLLHLLERDQFVYWHRMVETSDVVRDIFWTHPDAIKLLNAFHIVLLIDSTYKTNRYRLPLLEIVGVASTELTFSVAFAYLEFERVDNLTWVLEKLRGLILKDDAIPQVIVTDRDISLMTAVQTIFPTSTNLLCQFHIDKNVKAKCKMFVSPTEAWEPVMDAWNSIMDSPDETKYAERLIRFEVVCSPWPFFVDYVNKTWLLPHKEKFVKAWTDRVMHMGNTTSSRAESAHSTLKTMLQNSMGDLCKCWDAMNNMITLQHTEIRASMEESLNVVGHRFNIRFYNKLRGFVSRSALTHIADEYDRVKNVGIDSSICGCTVRTTYGLPCACVLARYLLGTVPLETVHIHWRRLGFNDQGMKESWSELSVQHELNVIQRQFDELDIFGKIALKSRLHEIAYPNMTSIPVVMHPYIELIVDVKADENCGYRAIAALLDKGEESWAIVRHDLTRELGQWCDEYAQLLGGHERVKQLRQSLYIEKTTVTTQDKKMIIPDMGYVIASAYRVVLVFLSLRASMTFFPLRGSPPSYLKYHRVICIASVNDNHFLQVFLKPESPIPSIASLWSKHCHKDAYEWMTSYVRRIQDFHSLVHKHGNM